MDNVYKRILCVNESSFLIKKNSLFQNVVLRVLSGFWAMRTPHQNCFGRDINRMLGTPSHLHSSLKMWAWGTFHLRSRTITMERPFSLHYFLSDIKGIFDIPKPFTLKMCTWVNSHSRLHIMTNQNYSTQELRPITIQKNHAKF